LSLLKKKEFTKILKLEGDEKIVMKIRLEEDKGDDPEEEALGSNEVEIVKILNVPSPFKVSRT
jgi:hypothetical protein